MSLKICLLILAFASLPLTPSQASEAVLSDMIAGQEITVLEDIVVAPGALKHAFKNNYNINCALTFAARTFGRTIKAGTKLTLMTAPKVWYHKSRRADVPGQMCMSGCYHIDTGTEIELTNPVGFTETKFVCDYTGDKISYSALQDVAEKELWLAFP